MELWTFFLTLRIRQSLSVAVSPEEYRIGLGDDFRNILVCGALALFFSGYLLMRQFTDLTEFHSHFPREFGRSLRSVPVYLAALRCQSCLRDRGNLPVLGDDVYCRSQRCWLDSGYMHCVSLLRR